MFTRTFQIYYETPGGTSAPGTAQPSQPQPGAPGQGQPGQDGFRTTYFPNVPDEVWGAMEPHLQNINRHVTQTEQRYAPLKGYTPEAVQGLAQFAQAFDQDPVGQWIRLARMLEQNGVPGFVDLDVDYLESILSGEDPDAQQGPQVPPQLGGLPPEVTQVIQGLQQQVEQLTNRLSQGEQTAQQRAEDRALQIQLDTMKTKLTEGGIPEELISQEQLLSSFIAHRGNVQAAVDAALDYRNKTLSGYVQNADPTKNRQNKDLDTSKTGVPKTSKRPGSNRRGMFRDVSAAAEQALAKAQSAD